MTPFLEGLEAAALAWQGTPFCERGAVKGAGVSCHLLCFVLYRDAGWLPGLLEIPMAPVGWARAQNRSLMEDWLDGLAGRAWFDSTDPANPQPGDLLGFKVGHCVHHLAVMLAGGRLVSSVTRLGVRVSPCIQPVWKRRLVRAWRPHEH